VNESRRTKQAEQLYKPNNTFFVLIGLRYVIGKRWRSLTLSRPN